MEDDSFLITRPQLEALESDQLLRRELYSCLWLVGRTDVDLRYLRALYLSGVLNDKAHF